MATNKSLKNKTVLITCGPTWIPIDDVRIISNKSTGTLGEIMARDFTKAGAKVTLLEGPVTEPIEDRRITVRKFYFYDEFYKLIKREVKREYDVVIHAAAVSDYKLRRPYRKKVSSQKKKLSLDLVPTQKIIQLIKKLHPRTFLVGFKLESALNRKSILQFAKDLFTKAKCDLVIVNNTTDKKYSGYIIDQDQRILAHEISRKAISQKLLKAVKSSI